MAHAKPPRPYDATPHKVPRDVKVWRCESCGSVPKMREPPRCQRGRTHEKAVDTAHTQEGVEPFDDAPPPLP